MGVEEREERDGGTGRVALVVALLESFGSIKLNIESLPLWW